MNKIIIIMTLCCMAATSGCSGQKSISGNYKFKTECLGSELDGSITVKAWGNGRNRADAVEQAQKNAVFDVVFKGIIEGKDECYHKPLAPEVNARLKYEDYFNRFFSDKGDFRRFVSSEDARFSDRFKRDPRESRHGSTYGIVLRVLRSELKERLINDGIIKK